MNDLSNNRFKRHLLQELSLRFERVIKGSEACFRSPILPSVVCAVSLLSSARSRNSSANTSVGLLESQLLYSTRSTTGPNRFGQEARTANYFARSFRKGGEIYPMATTAKLNIDKATVRQLFKVVARVAYEIDES